MIHVGLIKGINRDHVRGTYSEDGKGLPVRVDQGYHRHRYLKGGHYLTSGEQLPVVHSVHRDH